MAGASIHAVKAGKNLAGGSDEDSDDG